MAHERRLQACFRVTSGRRLRVHGRRSPKPSPFRKGTHRHAEGLCSGHAPCPFSLKRDPSQRQKRHTAVSVYALSSLLLSCLLLHAERRERVCGYFQNSNPEMKASTPTGYGPAVHSGKEWAGRRNSIHRAGYIKNLPEHSEEVLWLVRHKRKLRF